MTDHYFSGAGTHHGKKTPLNWENLKKRVQIIIFYSSLQMVLKRILKEDFAPRFFLRAVYPSTIVMTDFRRGLRPRVLTQHPGDR